MLVKTVETFKNGCKHKDYHTSVLLKMDTLLGYGYGQVGFFKLILTFGHPLKFITKHKITQYAHVESAATVIDQIINYFLAINEDQDDTKEDQDNVNYS